jgi:glycosyltransferase involved in cell wall biosynthesis/thymidylate kinase
MKRIVAVIGTDGSGKTTLSDHVTELMGSTCSVERVWLGAESRLMMPARALLKLVWKRGRGMASRSAAPDQSMADYRSEIARKNQLATRHPWATWAYITLVMTDYRLQVAAKLRRYRKLDVIVADRCLFDVAVNLGLALGWSPQDVVAFCQRQLAWFPTPQVRVFLRVEPEVSLSRKTDIPDIDYLRLRLAYYDAIAGAFGFMVLDGTEPIADNAKILRSHVLRELDRPSVHYVHSNNSDVGGADRVLALMAQHMRTPAGCDSNGFRVAVSLREATPAVDTYTRSGIPAIVHPFVRPQVSGGIVSVAHTLLRVPGTVLYFRRLLGRERPDLVHVNDLYDFLPALAARSRGIPVVYHLRMIKTNATLRRAFKALIPALATGSVSVSEAVRRHYFPQPDQARHRAEVIHDLGNSSLMSDQGDVREASQRPEPLPRKGRLVVMVGRIEPWKGQDVFLDAVRRLPNDLRAAHTFALVGGEVPGKSSFFDQVANDAGDLGVHFLGNRTDVPVLLRAADVSVHCSTAPDPFPGVVIESLLAGAATVAADAGGVPEMIQGPDMGILVEPGNSRSLSEALTQLLTMTNPPRYRYAALARERARSLVNPHMIDARMLELYESTISGATARPAPSRFGRTTSIWGMNA